jgi:uncharacterized protein (DUF58 family)
MSRAASASETGGYTVLRTRGAGFLGAAGLPLLLLYLFSPFYLLRFMAFFLFFILLGSKLYSEYLIRNIVLIRRDRELRVFRDDWASVEIMAENRGRLPAFMLALSDSPGRLPVFRENKSLRTLGIRSRMVITWRAYCSTRGIFTLGPAGFRGADPLGLFPFSVTARETTKLFIYPAPAMIDLNTAGGIPLGTLITGNPLYEDVTRCRSLREYRSGDEPRRINWKATARLGTLRPGAGPAMGGAAMLVNEYDSTLSYPLVVFLNLDPAAYSLRKRELFLERAIEAAAALCLMASRARQEMGIVFYTPGVSPEASGEAGGTAGPVSVISPAAFTLVPILERLAALERHQGQEAGEGEGRDEAAGTDLRLRGAARVLYDQGAYLPYGTRLVYTGPDLGDEAYIILNGLKRYHVSPEYLIIDEHSLPAVVPGNSPRYSMKESGYEII